MYNNIIIVIQYWYARCYCTFAHIQQDRSSFHSTFAEPRDFFGVWCCCWIYRLACFSMLVSDYSWMFGPRYPHVKKWFMVFLDLLGLQLSAKSGEEIKKTSGDSLQTVKYDHCKNFVQGRQLLYLCTLQYKALYICTLSLRWIRVAILRLFLLPSMVKYYHSIYSNHWGC